MREAVKMVGVMGAGAGGGGAWELFQIARVEVETYI